MSFPRITEFWYCQILPVIFGDCGLFQEINQWGVLGFTRQYRDLPRIPGESPGKNMMCELGGLNWGALKMYGVGVQKLLAIINSTPFLQEITSSKMYAIIPINKIGQRKNVCLIRNLFPAYIHFEWQGDGCSKHHEICHFHLSSFQEHQMKQHGASAHLHPPCISINIVPRDG